MIRGRLSRVWAGAAAIVLIASEFSGPAVAGDLTITENADYSSGHYGDTEPTEIYYDALSAKYETGLTTIKLTLPYLWINGSSNVRPDVGRVSAGSGTSEYRHGVGDLVAGLSQGITPDWLPGGEIDFTGRIKFSTASASAGLGTGSNDYSAEVGLIQDLGAGWTAFGNFGRRFSGEPVGTESGFRDAWYGGIGGQRAFGWGGSVTLTLDARGAVSDVGANDIALTAAYAQKLPEGWKLNLFAARGLSRDAPEWEFGFSIGFRFEP
jgi:hypothetical protein